MVGAAPAVIDDTSVYYRLETDVGGTAGCLEGNRRADDSVLKGAAFVDDCQDVTGQLWKLVPREQAGYYHLQTLFLEDQNKCFEGNAMSPDSELGGASYLGDCGEATGQDWKLMDAGDGAYRLQTAFLEAENKCLEGNRLEATALLGGAAHMSDCRAVPGQLWKLVPVADTSTAVSRALVDVQGARRVPRMPSSKTRASTIDSRRTPAERPSAWMATKWRMARPWAVPRTRVRARTRPDSCGA